MTNYKSVNMNQEQLDCLSKLENNQEVQRSLDLYKAEENRVPRKENKSQNVIKSLSPSKVVKTPVPSSSSAILDKMKSPTSWADEVDEISSPPVPRTRAPIPKINADPIKLSTSLFKMEEAIEQFRHWESIFPDTRLTPFFSTHLHAISEPVLLVCAEDLQKTTVDTDTNWKDVQWFLILTGSLAQAQNESSKKSKDMMDELSRLLTSHKEDFMQVTAQQETLISGTKDIQVTCEKTVSALATFANKIMSTPKPEPPKPSPYIPPPPPQLGNTVKFKYGHGTITLSLPSKGIQMHQSLITSIPDVKKFVNGLKTFSDSLLKKLSTRDLEQIYIKAPEWTEEAISAII